MAEDSQQKELRTPLLRLDERVESVAPLSILEEGDFFEPQTDFSRLLSMVSTSTSAAAASSDPMSNPHQPLQRLTAGGARSNRNDEDRIGGGEDHRFVGGCASHTVLIVAGTLSVLHAAFVWASFVAERWSDAVLCVTVPLFRAAETPQRIALLSTSLAAVLQQLSQFWCLALFLWTTSLLVPCLFMILSPSWIGFGFLGQPFSRSPERATGSIHNPRYWAAGSGAVPNVRSVLEMSLRWALFVVYWLVFVALACQYIEMEWEPDTKLALHNRLAPASASFAVGIACAIIVIVLLRWQSTFSSMRDALFADEFADDDALAPIPEIPPQRPVLRTPPRSAFQHSLGLLEEDEEVFSPPRMRILEEEGIVGAGNEAPTRGANEDPVPDVEDAPAETTPTPLDEDHPSNTSFLQILLVFQAGLMSILCWIPALALPALQFEFDGVAANLMKQTTRTLYLYDVPGLLLRDAAAAQSPPWIVPVLALVLLAATVGGPAAATYFSIATWMSTDHPPSRVRSTSRNYLRAVHPAMGGIVSVCAMVAMVVVLEPWSTNVFNSGTSEQGICEILKVATGQPCLIVRGSLMKGGYFFVGQAILLELLVILTLCWS
jgi:hypothetical protein